MEDFELDINVIGKNARAFAGALIVGGKPLMTTYEVRSFLRDVSKGKSTIAVKVIDKSKEA